jgi:hypothetical protein
MAKSLLLFLTNCSTFAKTNECDKLVDVFTN